jgi:uncharacterized protein
MFDLRTLRLSVGDSHLEPIELTLAPFTIGGERNEPVPARVPANLRVTRLTSGMLFDLNFEARVFGPCQRCLEEARVGVAGESREYQAHQPDPDAQEDMSTPYLAGDLLDTDRWAQDTLVLAMPLKVLCREDCAGLCPQCGRDLNAETCTCAVREPDERWAKLKDLL